MSDYLADVTLPPQPEIEPEPEQPKEEEVEETPDSGEDNPNFVYRDDPDPISSDDDDPLPPEPVKKTKLLKEDIFKSKPSKDKPLEVKEIVKPAPIKKPKRKMTEKQLEGLAKGRMKRQEKAKANKEEKERVREEKRAQRDQDQEQKDLRREEREARPKPVVTEKSSFTKKDLEDATFKAVEMYDTRRKARKVVKQKEQALKKHEEKVFKDINSQIGQVGGGMADPWDQCFKF